MHFIFSLVPLNCFTWLGGFLDWDVGLVGREGRA